MVGVLGMHISPIAVNIPFVAQFVGDDKKIHSNEIMDQAAGAMLDELLRLDSALAPLRAEAARA